MISAETCSVESMALFWSLCDLLDSGYPDTWCSRLSVSRGRVSGVIGKIVFSNPSCFVVTGICSTRFGSLFRQGLLLTVFASDCQVVYLSAQIAEANLQGDEERPGSYVCLCNGEQVSFSSWSCLCIEGQKCMEKTRRCMMGTVPIIQQVRCLNTIGMGKGGRSRGSWRRRAGSLKATRSHSECSEIVFFHSQNAFVAAGWRGRAGGP